MSQTDIAQPQNPEPLSEANIYKACKAFVLAYALPSLNPDNIIQGWQNRAALPASTNEYAVISILFDRQHGTTVETFLRSTSTITSQGLVEVAVQIDFCAENDVARQRAQRLAIMTRSSIGVQFFNNFGMSALYADDVRDLSFVGDAKQFVRRYSTTLHLSYWSGIQTELASFDTIKLARIENVDVHHPINPKADGRRERSEL